MRILTSRFFPTVNRKKGYKYDALIGVGGNQGDVKKTFDKLIRCFMGDRRLRVLETSIILKNPPFGYLDQDDFLNAVVKIETSMDAKSLLKVLQHYEKRFKRVRNFKDAPRTLDLDILFFNNEYHDRRDLKIPHPKWHERASVTVPLGTMVTI